MKKIILITIAILMIIITGCTSTSKPSSIDSTMGASTIGDGLGLKQDSTIYECPITEYENGVVFFGCHQGSFVLALSNYIGIHNVTATSNSPLPKVGSYNDVYGYVVTFKNNSVGTCSTE